MNYTEPYYYCISPDYLNALLAKHDGGAELFSSLSFAAKADCRLAKQRLEDFLSSQNQLCKSWWMAVDKFFMQEPYEFVSTTLADVKYYLDGYFGWPAVFASTYKYGFKKIDILFYMLMLNEEGRKRKVAVECTGATVFEMLAKMLWDAKNEQIVLTPLIISDMR
jgi:hypothetical protein